VPALPATLLVAEKAAQNFVLPRIDPLTSYTTSTTTYTK